MISNNIIFRALCENFQIFFDVQIHHFGYCSPYKTDIGDKQICWFWNLKLSMSVMILPPFSPSVLPIQFLLCNADYLNHVILASTIQTDKAIKLLSTWQLFQREIHFRFPSTEQGIVQKFASNAGNKNCFNCRRFPKVEKFWENNLLAFGTIFYPLHFLEPELHQLIIALCQVSFLENKNTIVQNPFKTA